VTTYLTSERVEAARQEIRAKSNEEIELATAIRWACRAVACFEVWVETGDLQWRDRGVLAQHEAAEHAAEAGLGVADEVVAELGAYARRILG
jgi:hypothetical protein